MQKSAVVEVRSEELPDGKRLLKTESNLDLTINKCHLCWKKMPEHPECLDSVFFRLRP